MEVQRLDDALSACRSKVRMGLVRSGLRLGLAVGQELLVFVDLDRPLTLVEQRLDWRTNYSQTQLGSGQDASAWLKQVGFPSHGVIPRQLNRAEGPIFKDLTHAGDLQDALDACRRLDSPPWCGAPSSRVFTRPLLQHPRPACPPGWSGGRRSGSQPVVQSLRNLS